MRNTSRVSAQLGSAATLHLSVLFVVIGVMAAFGTPQRVIGDGQQSHRNWLIEEQLIYLAGISAVLPGQDTLRIVETVHWWTTSTESYIPPAIGPVSGELMGRALRRGYSPRLVSWEEAFTETGWGRPDSTSVVLGPIDFMDPRAALFRLTVVRDESFTQYRVLSRHVDGEWIVEQRSVEILS